MSYHNYNVEDFLNDESFVRWVKNQDASDLNSWESLLRKYPDKREEMQLAVSLILRIAPEVLETELEQDAEGIWNSLSHKITYNKLQNHRSKRLHRLLSKTWFQAAAGLLMVFGLALAIYSFGGFSNKDSSSNIENSKEVKSNPKGRKSTITLSDQTQVALNAQSRIEYLGRFGKDVREVNLTGEAFFDVERDEDRPFIINVNGVTVRVLGTSFNIKGYPGDDHVKVTVASGQVEVFDIHSNKSIQLGRNEQVSFAYSSGGFTKRTVNDTDNVFGWKDQKLVFRDQDLISIGEELSRWYGVEVAINDQVNVQKKITGLYHNASLREVMEGLSHNYQFKYELDGKTLKIY